MSVYILIAFSQIPIIPTMFLIGSCDGVPVSVDSPVLCAADQYVIKDWFHGKDLEDSASLRTEYLQRPEVVDSPVRRRRQSPVAVQAVDAQNAVGVAQKQKVEIDPENLESFL